MELEAAEAKWPEAFQALHATMRIQSDVSG